MPNQKSKSKSVRLPGHVSPKRYKLLIKPDMEAFTFTGEETISLELSKTSKQIVLHSKEIEITDGWYEAGKTKIDVSKITYQTSADTASIFFTKQLPKGNGKLILHFRGVISEKLHGFYRSQYQHLGETKYLATTQFESTDARRAFPCFDEPAHKAVFELSLLVPGNLTTISNTIERKIIEQPTPEGVEHGEGYKLVHFAPTPKMSTYLLAYILGDFESVETKTKDGVRIRIFTTPGKKKQAKFALDVAKRSLEFLNKYFAIPYPLLVLDLIAIPDFSAGAMENWGAITFRETAILVDEEHTAFANRQQIAETIAHELVHQWFGNLVTMEWWTHLWLNESFASFMSYVVIDDIFPEWKFWTRFVLHDHANALHLDSLKNTHPIEVEVHHPDQISEIFDAISYDKGASILRMLYHYIGPEFFRDGLRHYLKKHSYKNTTSEHLWESFEKVSKKPVQAFMHTWVSKEGYPLLTVDQQKDGQVLVKQARYSLQNDRNDKTLWPVPVQFQLSHEKVSRIDLLSTKQLRMTIGEEAEYVKSNPGETAFHRTLYSPQFLAKLYEPVRKKELSTMDRFGIIRDLGSLAKSGDLSTSVFLEFVNAYTEEDSYVIWAEICGTMGEIYNVAQDYPKLQKQLAVYYRKLLQKVVKSVGWNPEHKESNSRTLLRSLVLSQYGQYGDQATAQKALQMFKHRKRKPITPNMRALVYTLTAKYGTTSTFKELSKMFTLESLQEEQRRIARGLMSFEDPSVFKNSLDFLLTDSVRSQDMPILVHIGLQNIQNREIAWKWLQRNWPVIGKRYHKDHLLVWMVKPLGNFASESKAKQVTSFFKKHPTPTASRAIKQSLEQIKVHADWIQRDRKDIENCIKAHLKV